MKRITLILMLISIATIAFAQMSPELMAKRERHKNLIVKEWNKDAKGRNAWLDHITTYDDQGRKIEEMEYSTYGMVERILFYYEDSPNGKVTKDVVYDSRNKPYRIRKYEYNSDATRRTQYNYLPNGKLYSVKTYEYIFEEQKQPSND